MLTCVPSRTISCERRTFVSVAAIYLAAMDAAAIDLAAMDAAAIDLTAMDAAAMDAAAMDTAAMDAAMDAATIDLAVMDTAAMDVVVGEARRQARGNNVPSNENFVSNSSNRHYRNLLAEPENHKNS